MKMATTVACPACSCKRWKHHDECRTTMVECLRCGARFGGSMYRGDFLGAYMPGGRMGHRDYCKVPGTEDARYYAMTIIGSNGVTHWHGWVCNRCGCVVQEG